MIDLKPESIEQYLKRAFRPDAKVLGAGEIGTLDAQGMKDFGYGKPLLVRFSAGGEVREAVFSVMKGDKYGHQFYWDRAHVLIFQFETSGRLEKHVQPLGIGYVNADDELVPLEGPKEFFLVTEKVDGYDYFLDLERIRKGDFRPEDVDMARQLARWLARVHAEELADPDLYYRRIRNLIGADECIFGLIDEAYPAPFPEFSKENFIALEKRIIDWRWKLRGYAHRLAAVHGDFHPWNVLITQNGTQRDFRVLDRSRGEWGEPAGDLATMAVNYLLFGLYDKPKLDGPFLELYTAYFSEYLDRTRDMEALEVIAPFFVFRGLVVASPEWYPNHPPEVRRGLLNFVTNVLEDRAFDWQNINSYMK